MAEWWMQADAGERAQVVQLPHLRQAGIRADEPFSDGVRDGLLASLFAAGSDLLLAPVQDLFGWRDRINVPASISETNWSWRLPWPADHLSRVPEAARRAGELRALVRLTGRE
jgi:4-alpha-glucanotransferase